MTNNYVFGKIPRVCGLNSKKNRDTNAKNKNTNNNYSEK